MVITYHGGACFRVSFGDTTLVFNPPSKESKQKSVRFGADIALVSADHPDFSGADTLANAGKAPFAIDGPGAYEIKGVVVKGFPSEGAYEGAKLRNTIYLVTLEDMNLCFLGALSSRKLSADVVEELDGVDLLFVPVGGGTLDASAAHELAVELEPSITIPMLYAGKELSAFLKEEGAEGAKPLEKLTLKMRDLEGKEGEVAVLVS